MSDQVEENAESASTILDRPFDLGGDSTLSSEEMDKLYSMTMQDFREGEVVRGTVVEVGSDRILVDIGYKSEGSIATYEFPVPGDLVIGQEFEVYIEAPEDDQGMLVLSKIKADRIKNWAHIQDIYEADGTIDGKIVRRVKGGLKVDIGVDAFMPASQLTWRPTGDLERYIGQTMELKIIKLTKRRRNVVVSRRRLLEEQRAGEKSKLLETIAIGKTLRGEVKNITDFGAFVDVGGIDGLLHVTDMSWGRVKHPSQVVSVGQTIEVMVLNFDPKTERISLGLKQMTENPWKTTAERYPVGNVVRGKVVSMTDYGAFVQIEQGIEGMVHVSEMSWTRRVRHPSEVLGIEEEIDVMVLSVSPDEEKIALGLKQTQPNPWTDIEARYPAGSVVKGIVRNLADYGAFIQIEEGIDGLLHVSDLSWTHKVNHPSEMLERGQELDVKILSIDLNSEKISVGLKQLDEDPWEGVIAKIKVNDDVEVEIAKLVSFGAFARLESGVEGLIHVSEIGDDRIAKPEEALTIGEKVKARVISIDSADRKIGLSIRAYNKGEVAQLQADYGQSVEAAGESHPESASVITPTVRSHAGRTLADAASDLKATIENGKEASPEEPVSAVAEVGSATPEAEAPTDATDATPEAPTESGDATPEASTESSDATPEAATESSDAAPEASTELSDENDAPDQSS